MTLDLPHILSTASFADAEARAECERRIIEERERAVKAEREECAAYLDNKANLYKNAESHLVKLFASIFLHEAAAIRARNGEQS